MKPDESARHLIECMTRDQAWMLTFPTLTIDEIKQQFKEIQNVEFFLSVNNKELTQAMEVAFWDKVEEIMASFYPQLRAEEPDGLNSSNCTCKKFEMCVYCKEIVKK